MELRFSGEVWFWRGPSPFHFVTVPEIESAAIKSIAPALTYGWGAIPCAVVVGETRFTTSLFPKNGGYVLPLKTAVRTAEDIDLGDEISVTIIID